MKYILNNPENRLETEEYLCNERANTRYKIKSVENKTLYGYYMGDGVVPLSELDGEGLYKWGKVGDNYQYIKMEVEIGERCSEETLQEIRTKLQVPDGVELDASSCTFTYEDVTYSYILTASRNGSTFYNLFNMDNDEHLRLEYVANSETAVYTGTYILEGTSAVTITSYNGSRALDADENEYTFLTIQPGNLISVPAHDDIYSSINLPGYFKYIGNGTYTSSTPLGGKCNGTFREEGQVISFAFGVFSNHGDYIYHDLLFDTGSNNKEEMTVIGMYGDEITLSARKLIINFDGEYLKCAIGTYTYPSHSSEQYLFTGTTWDNLTHCDYLYLPLVKDYHITKFGAESENNYICSPVPCVAYDSETKSVYYNKKGIEIFSLNLGMAIYVIKNRTWDFTRAFNDYINSIYNLGCGGYDLPKDAISKVYGDGEDITSIIMGQGTIFSLLGLYYEVRVNGSWERTSFSTITIEFTEEFFNNGKIYVNGKPCEE